MIYCNLKRYICCLKQTIFLLLHEKDRHDGGTVSIIMWRNKGRETEAEACHPALKTSVRHVFMTHIFLFDS